MRRGLVAAVASNLAVGVVYFNLNGSAFAIVVRWMFWWSFFFHHVTFYWNLLHSGILILTFYKLKMFAVDWKQNVSSANTVRHGEETSSFEYLCAASSNCQFDLDLWRIMAVSVFIHVPPHFLSSRAATQSRKTDLFKRSLYFMHGIEVSVVHTVFWQLWPWPEVRK